MSATIDDLLGFERKASPDDSFHYSLVAGTYQVGRRLGSGGMGEVREAEHVRLGRPVAIKFLLRSSRFERGSIERFEREARRAAAVRSEYVVKVFDYGQLEDETPYFVMERLFGEDLRALLARERPLPVRRAVKLVHDACRGLCAVHSAGLVHRDLKPANLFVETTATGGERCVILDFGVAKALASDTTRQGALVGTVRYMAPEQLEDSRKATASADIYALGAILYEALSGVPAHGGDTLEEMMFDILHRDPQSLAHHRPLPERLDAVVMRMLARKPDARFSSIEEVARALAPFGALDATPRELAESADVTSRDLDATGSRPSPGLRQTRAWAALVAAWSAGVAGGWCVHGRAPLGVAERVPQVAGAEVAHTAPPLSEPRPSTPSSLPRPLQSVAAEFAAAPPPTRASQAPHPRRSGMAPGHPAQASLTRPSATEEASLPSGFDAKDPYE